MTGADGFIGSHLTEALVRSGCDIRAFVFYNSFNSWGWLDHLEPEIQDKIEIFMGDIRDPHGVRTALHGCDYIFHLAALIGIPFSYHSPDAYVDTNIKGTLNLLQAARDMGIKKFIHTSTSEVYGSAQTVPITEKHPLHGQSPYAATKIGADQIAMSFHESFDLPVTIVRPFNTYGPRQSARAVIPTIITQLANGKQKIKLGALHPTRDFNFVLDTVRGFIAAAESPATTGEILNLGTGFEISIGDLAQLISELMHTPLELENDAERLRPLKSEVKRLCADATKVQRLTGWKPQSEGKEGLIQGLQETIHWFSDRNNLAQYKSYLYNL